MVVRPVEGITFAVLGLIMGEDNLRVFSNFVSHGDGESVDATKPRRLGRGVADHHAFDSGVAEHGNSQVRVEPERVLADDAHSWQRSHPNSLPRVRTPTSAMLTDATVG